ncbi:hypothetical protein DLJ82_1845 [Rhizobium leguminosarum]|uniref:Uncharacterized protein n=1 Tax=Rhizobium leguminosarum TaxID=384 RepID=A0A2Z4YDV7_RHILE|nr:hypothetical protein DLJ82_1845 [Rhizobium leguminosarum]
MDWHASVVPGKIARPLSQRGRKNLQPLVAIARYQMESGKSRASSAITWLDVQAIRPGRIPGCLANHTRDPIHEWFCFQSRHCSIIILSQLLFEVLLLNCGHDKAASQAFHAAAARRCAASLARPQTQKRPHYGAGLDGSFSRDRCRGTAPACRHGHSGRRGRRVRRAWPVGLRQASAVAWRPGREADVAGSCLDGIRSALFRWP